MFRAGITSGFKCISGRHKTSYHGHWPPEELLKSIANFLELAGVTASIRMPFFSKSNDLCACFMIYLACALDGEPRSMASLNPAR
jgi:hypothetical protein